MEAIPREIRHYKTNEGIEPFREWFLNLNDIKAKVAIAKRLERVQLGNLGCCDKVGDGVLELKFYVGAGYRVYLGQDVDLVILLSGGEKHRQYKDIMLAKEYWADYQIHK